MGMVLLFVYFGLVFYENKYLIVLFVVVMMVLMVMVLVWF